MSNVDIDGLAEMTAADEEQALIDAHVVIHDGGATGTYLDLCWGHNLDCDEGNCILRGYLHQCTNDPVSELGLCQEHLDAYRKEEK